MKDGWGCGKSVWESRGRIQGGSYPASSRGTSLWQWNSTLSSQRSAKGEGVHNALVGQEGHISVKMR